MAEKPDLGGAVLVGRGASDVTVATFPAERGGTPLTDADLRDPGVNHISVSDLRVGDVLALPTHGVGECVAVTDVRATLKSISTRRLDGGALAPATVEMSEDQLNTATFRPMAILRHPRPERVMHTPTKVNYFLYEGKAFTQVIRSGRSWEAFDSTGKKVPALLPFGVSLARLATSLPADPDQAPPEPAR